MEVLATFYQLDVIGCWTVVKDERDPQTGYRTMLALVYDARMFSQFTEGYYEPGGGNSHLGAQVCLMGKHLVEHVAGRLREDGDGTTE